MSNPSDKNPEKPSTAIAERPKESSPSLLSPKESEIKHEERQEKGKTTEQTSDLKREILEGEIIGRDKETADRILSLDISKKLTEQMESYGRLEIVSYTLLGKLFANGYKIEVLKELESLRSITIDSKITLNGVEKVALKKLVEIASHPGSKLFMDLKAKWATLIEQAKKTYDQSDAAKRTLFPEKGQEPAKPEEGTVTKIVDFVKKHPVVTSVVLAAGAYGVYKLFFSESKKEGENTSSDKKSWWDKAKVPGGILAGLLVLGALVGPERITEWIEKAFKLSKGKMERFISLISEGRYKDAILSLFEGTDTNMDNYKKIAEKITQETKTNVTDSTIQRLADAKYGMFISVTGQAKAFAASVLKELPGASGIIATILDTDEQVAQEKAIRDYLDKHKTDIEKINPGKDATLYEVLAALNNIEVQNMPKEGPSSAPVSEVIDTGLGETVAVASDTAKKIAEELKGKPHFYAFMNKYENNWGNAVAHPMDFLNELFSACKEDLIPVGIGSGVIVIWNGVKFIEFTSINTLYETAKKLIEAPFSDKVGWSDAIGTYMVGASPFIIIGAGYGGLAGMIRKDSTFLGGMLKGAGKGVLFPIKVAQLNVQAGQWMYREGRGAAYKIARMTGPEIMKPQILTDEARYYASVFNHYDELERLKSQGGLLNPKKWYAKFSLEKIRNMKTKYLNKFASVYKDLPGGRVLPTGSSGEIDDAAKELRRFYDEQKGQGKIKPEPLETAKREETFRKADGTMKTQEELKTDSERLKKEIDGLEQSNPLRKAKAKELMALEAYLNTSHATGLKIESTQFDKLDETARAAKIEASAAQMEAAEKGLQARFNAEVEKITKEAKEKGVKLTDASITAKLEKLDQEMTIPFAKQKQASMETLLAEYKKLSPKSKTVELSSQMRRAMEGSEGTVMTRLCKGAKGRAKMMVLMGALIFATDQIIHRNDPERELKQILDDLGPEFGQLILDILPIAGTFSNYYSAFSGREIVTNRDVSNAWDRTSNVIWGTVGLAGDIVTVLGAVPSGGTDVGANIAIRLAKEAAAGSKVAAKTLKMWPQIERIAERMGGWFNFAKKLRQYLGESSKVIKGARAIEKVAFIGGTAMLVGGIAYSCRYAFVDTKTELEVPPEIANPDTLPEANPVAASPEPGPETKPAT